MCFTATLKDEQTPLLHFLSYVGDPDRNVLDLRHAPLQL